MEHTVSSFFDKLSFIVSYFTSTVSGERKPLLLARHARRDMPMKWKLSLDAIGAKHCFLKIARALSEQDVKGLGPR